MEGFSIGLLLTLTYAPYREKKELVFSVDVPQLQTETLSESFSVSLFSEG